MYIADKLESVQLPPVYIRDNKECYLDPYRKRLIQITPEETVRQKVLNFYETKLNVPRDMILVEASMTYYTQAVVDRADIIIHEPVDAYLMKPLAVIECKNESIALTDKVVDQAIKYCDYIGAIYIIVTNGIEIIIAKYNEEKNQYEWLDKLLTYSEMSNLEGEKITAANNNARMSLVELSENERLVEYNENNLHWIFGLDTPTENRSFIVNFYECLRDSEHLLPKKTTALFELLQDLGVRYMDYSNAGGGHYEGYYRSFLVKDLDGEIQILSVSLFGTDPNFRGERRNSYTSLVVAIDKGKISHNILQYNIDRFLNKKADVFSFEHNGQISARKSEDLKAFVSKYDVSWLTNDGKIALGEINHNKLFYLDNEEESRFIYNLLEYALLREKFKKST